MDGFYADLGRAVDSGVAAPDVPVGKTFENAAENPSLTNVCDLMSSEARRATVLYVRRSANLADVRWTCEKAMGLLLRRGRQRGELARSLKPTLVGINAKGDRATATVRLGGERAAVTSLPLIKERGAWRIAVSPVGDR